MQNGRVTTLGAPWSPVRTLGVEAWRARREDHHQRIDRWLSEHLARRSRRGRQSIEEFLFTYYSYRPAQLRRWHPGHSVALEGAELEDFGSQYVYDEAGLLRVDVGAILQRRRPSIEWICRLLKETAERSPHLGCFGMHEWAMIYRQDDSETRHNVLPLRLGAQASSALVEEIRVRCSHFEAFRFFTPAARPLNTLQPRRDTQVENEQPGCLHANMDVYRWAYKLSPLVSGELIADCFELAREIRTLDMRASPYDVTSIGLDPVPIETPEGRATYIRYQRDFVVRSGTLRHRLIDACENVLAVSSD